MMAETATIRTTLKRARSVQRRKPSRRFLVAFLLVSKKLFTHLPRISLPQPAWIEVGSQSIFPRSSSPSSRYTAPRNAFLRRRTTRYLAHRGGEARPMIGCLHARVKLHGPSRRGLREPHRGVRDILRG